MLVLSLMKKLFGDGVVVVVNGGIWSESQQLNQEDNLNKREWNGSLVAVVKKD